MIALLKHIVSKATAGTILAILSVPSYADPLPTLMLDIPTMPGKSIWGGQATMTPLAFDDQNKPSIVVVRLPAGTTADTAHAATDGRIRFAAVLSGTMFYADGAVVDSSKETRYPAGSILLISSGTKHWLSARKDDVVIMLTATLPENAAPAIQSQLREKNAKRVQTQVVGDQP